jgi:hypothetical protein
VAVEPISKTIPVLHHPDGIRSAHARRGHAVVHALRQRLAAGCMPVFTSDGVNHYFYAWVVGGRRQARQWQMAAGLIYGQ